MKNTKNVIKVENLTRKYENLIAVDHVSFEVKEGEIFGCWYVFPDRYPSAWAQPLANNLPLAFFNTAMRKITVEGMSFSDLLPQLTGLAIWAVIAYAAASRTFRWE